MFAQLVSLLLDKLAADYADERGPNRVYRRNLRLKESVGGAASEPVILVPPTLKTQGNFPPRLV